MKYVKLIAIFALVAVGLYFALIRPSVLPSKEEGGGFAKVDDVDIKKFNEETDSRWAEKDWDSMIYIDRRGDIEQCRIDGRLSRGGYNTLRNNLFESSVNALCSTYKASLKARTYGGNPTPKAFNARVTGVYTGVSFLMRQEDKTLAYVDSIPRLLELKQLNEYYAKVFKFVYSYDKKTNDYVRSEHTPHPVFNGEMWMDFKKKKENTINTAVNYKTGKNKALYDEMKTLPGVEEGLSQTWLERKIDPARDAYYDSLAVLIEDYVRKNYAYEVPSDRQCDSLDNQVRLGSSKVVYKDKLSEGLAKIENFYTQFVKEFGSEKKGKGIEILGDLKKEYKADFDKLPN